MRAPFPIDGSGQPRAKIVPFPLAHQYPLVMKLAKLMAAQLPADAEETLKAELHRRIDALHRQGFSDTSVECQVRAFEGAVRGELWQIVLLPPLSPAGTK